MADSSDEIARFAEIFRKAGARGPEGWARSQVEEGIPQLARFLFLRRAWEYIVSEDDSSWIDRVIIHDDKRPADPYAAVGHALKSLRAKGATDEEITDLVRGIQAELLFGLCYMLEDPGDVPDGVTPVDWGLFRLDEHGNPVEPIRGLHESVLDTDPTGREMRPRKPHN